MLPLLPNPEMPNLDAKMSLGNVKSCTLVATYLPLEPSSEAIIAEDGSDLMGLFCSRDKQYGFFPEIPDSSDLEQVAKAVGKFVTKFYHRRHTSS